MKKRNILFILPLLLVCGCSQNNIDTKENIINNLLNGINVKINGTESITYPENYSSLNYTSRININRDYATITEEDGTKTPVVRENTDYDFTTYLKGNKGQVVNEYLNTKNEVITVDYSLGGKQILFNEYFANPFEYVDTTDIGDDYSLNPLKAGLIVESYTGYQYQVKEAKFNIENNVATSLNITFYDKIESIVSSTEMINITNSLSLSINFDYNINISSHLTPRKDADETLKNAFTHKTNYTMTFESNATSDTSIIYVTEDAIFVHNGINDIGAKNGDIYYKKINDTYDKYEYRTATGSFAPITFGVTLDKILPTIENISPNILIKDSNNIYSFDKVASLYCLEEFILPSYSVTSGLGIKGTLQLENGNISSIYAQFNKTSPFSITQKYYNYEKTSMPTWLDTSSVK